MIRSPLSATAILDDSADIVALTAAPWMALPIATSLAYRLMQALFIDRLLELGGDAIHYGNVLGSTANLTIAAFVLSRWGRAVFARASRLAAATGRNPGMEALRVPAAAFASYLFTSSLAELISYATFVTIVGPIVGIVLGGLAAGTMEMNKQASISGSLSAIGRVAREIRLVTGLALVFGMAVFVALVNVAATFAIGISLANVFLGVDVSRWGALFSGENRRFVLLLIAGALIAVEPFWIAANVLLVRKSGEKESGEDLRVWFHRLREES